MSATSTIPSSAAIAGALKTLNKAISKVSNLPAGAVPAALDDFKLFELALAVSILTHAPWWSGMKWRCSTAPMLKLGRRPGELARATVFTAPRTHWAMALNVNVHYPGSPGWQGARHEADLVLFDASHAADLRLDHTDVYEVFEAKYRKEVAKSVLRELAFIATQLPASPATPGAKRVTLAVPKGPWKTTHHPNYWRSAHAYYGVSLVHLPFP